MNFDLFISTHPLVRTCLRHPFSNTPFITVWKIGVNKNKYTPICDWSHLMACSTPSILGHKQSNTLCFNNILDLLNVLDL